MNKDQATELVANVNASWGRDPNMEAFKDQCRVWFRFVHDLNLEDCMKVIDRLALSTSPFPPRPGDIRRRVIMGVIPDALEAWEEILEANNAVANGNDPPAMRPLTLATARRLGSQMSGLRTNGDRDRFVEFYRTVVDEEVQDKCQTTQQKPN